MEKPETQIPPDPFTKVHPSVDSMALVINTVLLAYLIKKHPRWGEGEYSIYLGTIRTIVSIQVRRFMADNSITSTFEIVFDVLEETDPEPSLDIRVMTKTPEAAEVVRTKMVILFPDKKLLMKIA